ncbi:tRNA lysidine(34) synthetase TilS, partial [Thermaurantiacus sp.]
LGPVPLPPGPGLQAAARQARYAAFARWCRAHAVPVLLTAHHADDQAETLLLRLGRGAGLAGLAGIRACQRIEGLLIVRPLLDVRREALRALVAARGWVPAEDPSNADPRFDRARVRRLLEGTEALDPVRVAASADHLAEAEAAIAWAVARAFESRFRDDRLDLDGLPRELARRLLARAFEARGVAVRGEAVARLLDRGQGTLGGVSARGAGNIWTFRAAPPRRVRQGQTRP